MSITRQLVKHVRDLAEQNPDYVYERPPGSFNCLYAYDGAPSCLIGQAAHLAGVSIVELEAWNMGTEIQVSSVAPRVGVGGESALRWLLTVQRHQDRAEPWAVAVAEADKRNPLYDAKAYA